MAHRETFNHFVTLWGLWGEGLSGRKGKSQMTQDLSSAHTSQELRLHLGSGCISFWNFQGLCSSSSQNSWRTEIGWD